MTVTTIPINDNIRMNRNNHIRTYNSTELNSLKYLYKLKYLQEEANLKINKSQIARDLNVDRRTVHIY